MIGICLIRLENYHYGPGKNKERKLRLTERMPHGENATRRKCHTEKMPHGENATWNEWKMERMENEKNVKWKVSMRHGNNLTKLKISSK